MFTYLYMKIYRNATYLTLPFPVQKISPWSNFIGINHLLEYFKGLVIMGPKTIEIITL